jgi:hypothetical protein
MTKAYVGWAIATVFAMRIRGTHYQARHIELTRSDGDGAVQIVARGALAQADGAPRAGFFI